MNNKNREIVLLVITSYSIHYTKLYDVKEVAAGMECGLTIKNYSDIKVGDVVEAYEEEEVKRTL